MENIAEFKSNEIFDIIESTLAVFLPLLEGKRAEIEEIPRKTFKYGSTDRHQLDVYYPTTPSASEKTQILVWTYGGGFTRGDRQLPAPADLINTCVGAYFARKGFLVIITDYRLVPDAPFPGAAEDVRDAVLWTINNAKYLTTPATPNPDTKAIFLMGHSAGAVHAFSALVIPETVESTVLRSSVAGLILCGGAYHFGALAPSHRLQAVVRQLYGGEEDVKEKAPIGLLRSASDTTVAALPRISLIIAERDPEWLVKAGHDFKSALETWTGKKPAVIFAQGHNHLSPHWALGTGQGETWAEEVIAWIKG